MNIDIPLIQLVLGIVALLAGGGIGHYLILRFVEKKKIDAEAKKINVSIDLEVAEAWRKLATETREELEKSETEYDAKIESLQNSYNKLKQEINETTSKYTSLKLRVEEFYRSISIFESLIKTCPESSNCPAKQYFDQFGIIDVLETGPVRIKSKSTKEE